MYCHIFIIGQKLYQLFEKVNYIFVIDYTIQRTLIILVITYWMDVLVIILDELNITLCE